MCREWFLLSCDVYNWGGWRGIVGCVATLHELDFKSGWCCIRCIFVCLNVVSSVCVLMFVDISFC